MSADTEAQSKPLELNGIVLTDKNLVEISGGKPMVRVDREDIQQITLRHGLIAPHPLIQCIAGLAMVGIGYYPYRMFLHWQRDGGAFHLGFAMVTPFVFLGAWLIFTTFKRGYFLDVQLQSDRKRLTFDATPTSQALESFVARLESELGMKILRSA